MGDNDLINEVYKISDKYKILLKGNLIINGDVNCIIFGHYCKSTLFYKDFFNVTKDILKVYRVSNKHLTEIKRIVNKYGYRKVWIKGVFSFYGDLRPLAIEAGFGEWSEDGLVENEKYGTNFLITAIFYK